MTDLQKTETPAEEPRPSPRWPCRRVSTTEPMGVGGYVHNYLLRVRGGDMGSLPAVGGLVVLVHVLPVRRVGLRLAEQLREHVPRGQRHDLHRHGPGLRPAARRDRPGRRLHRRHLRLGDGAPDGRLRLGLVRARSRPRSSPACSSALLTGVLVAKVRIPSFVVTLSFFLAFQGVCLLILDNGPGQHGQITLQRQGRQRVRQLVHADLDGLAARWRSSSSATPRRSCSRRRPGTAPGPGRRAGTRRRRQDPGSLAVVVGALVVWC